MKGKKNDFSMSFWKSGKRIFFMEYVHDTQAPIKWLDKVKNLTTGETLIGMRLIYMSVGVESLLKKLRNKKNKNSYT